MAKLIDELTWIEPGEKANAIVFNRTLKELVQKIDDKTLEVLPSNSGFSVNVDDIDTSNVSVGDFVYKRTDGKYDLTLGGDDIKDKVVGRWVNIDNTDVIVYNGLSDYPDLVVGKTYYLSDTEEGKLTDTQYNGAIAVGIAVSDTQILINASGGGSGGGSSSSELPEGTAINADDGDFVYIASNGDVNKAIVDGTEAENVMGVLSAGTRNNILYSGIKDGYSNLVTGSYYYLSATVPGAIQKESYPGAIKIGMANSSTEIIIDIDKSPTSSNDEELQYQFLLSDSSYTKCYFDTFSDSNTLVRNDGGDETNITYSAVNSSYTIKDTFSVQTNNIINENVKTFLITENAVGTYTREYSTDGGNTWVSVPENGKIWYVSGYTDFRLKYTSTQDNFELKSFGVLLNDQGHVGNTRVRLREYIKLENDLPTGTAIKLPYGQKYTNDNQSLNIIVEGMLLTPILDYTEIDNTSVSFASDLSTGDIIQFEEYYGYVDVSIENTGRINKIQRLDKEFEILDINNITYDVDDNIEEITYVTGNKEDWVRDGVLTHVDYYDTDGTTKLAKNEFTYDGNGRLLTTTWTNY